MLLLAGLSALAVLAGVAVGHRLYPESRTEAALHASLTIVLLVLVPIQALGWLGGLGRTTLAVSSAALSIATLAIASRGVGLGALAPALRSIGRLPLDAMIDAWRARSPTLVLLPATLGILLWTTWLAYLAPSGAWDGLWYHEPMVELALQHGTFDVYDMPSHLQWVNGYPRTSEHLMLWLSAFSGKALIDAVPSWMAVVALVAFAALAREHGRGWRTGAVGFACVLVTIPGAVLQLRSTYVDVTVLAAYLCALHYISRSKLRARDVWSASMGIAFLGGTKSTGLVFAGVLGLVLLVRAIVALRGTERRGVLLAGLAGLALIAALVAPSYARNVEAHGNPFWPLRVESAIFGTLEGHEDFGNMQWPIDQVVHEMFGAPTPGEDYHDTRRHAFGWGLTFLGLPMLVCALFALIVRALRGAATRRARPGDEGAPHALLQLFLGFVPLAISPAFYWARYALPTPASALIAIHAWLARSRSRPLGEAAIAVMGALNLLALFWAEPGWDVTIARAIDLASLAPEERAVAQTSHNLWPVDLARMREERIGAGDLVVFDDEVAFIGNLWNESITNRVMYVPFGSRDEYLVALRDLGPEWVAVRSGSAEAAALSSAESGYRQIGGTERSEILFERIDVP